MPEDRISLPRTLPELADALIAIAQEARRRATEGDVIRLHEMLEQVRSAAEEAEGERMLLLSVGEAFLKALSRSDLGKSEIALRRFFLRHADEAEKLMSAIIDRGQISRKELETVPMATELLDLGVLRLLQTGAIDIRPSMRPLARELLSPAPLRWWERVQNARAQSGFSGLSDEHARAFLAQQLGLNEQDAARHLRKHPIATTARRASPPAALNEDAAQPGDALTSFTTSVDRPMSLEQPPITALSPAAAQVALRRDRPRRETTSPLPLQGRHRTLDTHAS